MNRHSHSAYRLIPLAGMVLLTAAWLRQSALAQLGFAEAAARDLVMTEVREGGTDHRSRARSYTRLVIAGRKAYQKVPLAARGQLTPGLFAWVKAYLNTPGFSAEYARIREELKPVSRVYELTIEQEIKQEVDEQLAGHAQLKQAAATMKPADRDQMLANLKQAEAMLRSPEYLKAQRTEREEARARDEAGIERATAEWLLRYPATVGGFAARNLRSLLEGTAGVDYSAKLVTIVGEGGESLGFENEGYRTGKSWMWVESVLAGKEAVTAARAAAEAWLKELGAP